MRGVILFTFGALTAGTIASGWLVFARPDPQPTPPHAREVAELWDRLADETARRVDAERREVLHRTWSAIYRARLLELGRPQSWSGPIVSTELVRPAPANPDEPETIPPPPVPVPTREGQR